MAVKTKSFKLKSVKVNREFLKELGSFLEEEVDNRKKSEERPHFSVSYTINSREEALNVSSMGELLSVRFLPRNINSFIFRISHYDDKYVSIFLRIGKISSSRCEISSSDESNLLKIENDIKRLFSSHQTSWSFIYWADAPLSVNIEAGLFAIITIISLRRTIAKIGIGFDSFLKVYILTVVLFLFFTVFLIKFYPYNDFSFDEKSSFRKIFHWIFSLVIAGLVGNFAYEIIKYAFAR